MSRAAARGPSCAWRVEPHRAFDVRVPRFLVNVLGQGLWHSGHRTATDAAVFESALRAQQIATELFLDWALNGIEYGRG